MEDISDYFCFAVDDVDRIFRKGDESERGWEYQG